MLLQESADLIRNVNALVTGLLADKHTVIPVDIDVSPFDNSEKIGRRLPDVQRNIRLRTDLCISCMRGVWRKCSVA
jgi:hypothetical protein